jgi:hypothetical protein
MMLAWLSSSLMMTSSFVTTAGMQPLLAVKPPVKTSTESTCLNSASLRSSSSCTSMVPPIQRTAPAPTPQRSMASSAACRTRGSLARPK